MGVLSKVGSHLKCFISSTGKHSLHRCCGAKCAFLTYTNKQILMMQKLFSNP